MPRKVYRYSGAAWVRRGNPSIGSRPTNYGAYEPDATNSGLLVADYTHLNEYNSPSTTTFTLTPGMELADKIVYGTILPPATVGAEISNCYLPGSNVPLASGNDGVLSFASTTPRTGIVKVYDSEIVPRAESAGRNCVLGRQVELYRNYLHGGEDLIGFYNQIGPVADAKAMGNRLEDMGYFYPESHADGSHCDCIQIQGGQNIEVIGNSIRGTAHYMPGSGKYYPTHTTQDLGDWTVEEHGINPGAGVIINGNVAAVDSSVKVNYNYFHFCKQQLLIKSQANNFQAIGNRFSYVDSPAKHVNGAVVGGAALTFTTNPAYIRADNTATYSPNVDGITTAGVVTNTTNVWLDGPNAGLALTTPRASGVLNDNF